MLMKTLLFASLATATQEVNFTAKSSGGNATSPYAYGLMFEVDHAERLINGISLTRLGHQQQR